MNAAILQRLIWKEYRFLRSFWLATLLLAAWAAIAWRTLAAWYQRPVQVDDFFVLAALVTSLFALGAGGTMFATEHEVGTAEFLRRLPLDAKHLWCGKLVLCILSIVGLKAVLWTAAVFFSLGSSVNGEHLNTIWWCSLVSELELFAWATLFSLLTRQPLMAIVWGVTVASAIVHLVIPFLRLRNQYTNLFLLNDYQFDLPSRTALGLSLLLFATWLSTKWVRSPQPLSLVPDWLSRITFRRTNQSRWLAASATTQASTATAKGQLTRLIWLQWRQSRLLWGSLAVPVVLSGLWSVVTAPKYGNSAFLFAFSTGIFGLGLGVSVFHGQQAQFRFRYFAEHGVSPSRVWWGLQLASLAPIAASLALTFIVVIVNDLNALHSPMRAIEVFVPLLLAASIVYSISQLAGMLFRQGMVATSMGIVGLVIHVLWFVLLEKIGLRNTNSGALIALFGFAPLPISWLLVSRWHVANWIRERRTWAIRLRLGMCLVVPWMLMATGLMSYRVLEISNVGIEPPTRKQLLTLSDEERQAAELYEAAVRSFIPSGEPLPDDWMRPDLRQSLESAVTLRLRESNQPLEKILSATRRPVGAFAGEPKKQASTARFLLLVLQAAQNQGMESGSLEQTLELHEAARNLIHHWRRNTDFHGYYESNSAESALLVRLQKQLQTTSWRPEQYRELAGRVSEWWSQDDPGARAVEWAYREAFDELMQTEFSKSEPNRFPESRVLRWIPGEQARVARLLKAEFAVARARQGDWHPANPRPMEFYLWNTPWAASYVYEIQSQSYSAKKGNMLSFRRLLQASLELHARKAELGRWPDSADGIPGLGVIPNSFSFLPDNFQLDYLPQGLWDGRAPMLLTVREADGREIKLIGDEPCLALRIRSNNANFRDDLESAPTVNAREAMLRELPFVVPLDPLPAQQ